MLGAYKAVPVDSCVLLSGGAGNIVQASLMEGRLNKGVYTQIP